MSPYGQQFDKLPTNDVIAGFAEMEALSLGVYNMHPSSDNPRLLLIRVTGGRSRWKPDYLEETCSCTGRTEKVLTGSIRAETEPGSLFTAHFNYSALKCQDEEQT